MRPRHPQIPALVLVTGPPGSGKTTIARDLADALALPLLEKDALKETIGGALGVTGREQSHRVGEAVFELMADLTHDLLRRGVSLVVEGNFTTRSRLASALPPCRIVQVHVTAAPETLRDRIRSRDTHRHPVHYDAEAADEIAERARDGEWDALPLDGELAAVDTTDGFPEPDELRRIVSRSVSG